VSCGFIGKCPPNPPLVGDFELEEVIELEKFFFLKVPQIGGFRGRKISTPNKLINA
jgi:hypothetical protein